MSVVSQADRCVVCVYSHRLEELNASEFKESPQLDAATVLRLQAGNGMSLEDSQMIVEGMAQQGTEPTYCMGDDTPLPVLSDKPHVLYDYFKQRFAQVSCFLARPLTETDSQAYASAVSWAGS